MSLWRQRLAIEHAVAGLLTAEDDAKLRAHLRGCPECQRHYDRLTMQARILAGGSDSTRTANARELARLLAVIAPAAPASLKARRWPSIGFAAAVTVAVVVAVVSFREHPNQQPEVVRRGDQPPTLAQDFELLMFAAPPDGGAFEQKASFPGQPSVSIGRNVPVAFSTAQVSRRFGYLRAVLINDEDERIVLERGRSVALGPGRWRVFGIQAVWVSDQSLKKAVEGVDKNSRRLPLTEGIQSYGEIVVEP